jgi:hypothetical protein
MLVYVQYICCHSRNEVRLCVLGKIIKSLPPALSVSREERCEVLACRNPPSKRCIQLLVGCKLRSRLFSCWLSLSYLIFSCCKLPFCEFQKHTTALHYRYDMQMYCTFVLFVNQHFQGLPASGTHCIFKDTRSQGRAIDLKPFKQLEMAPRDVRSKMAVTGLGQGTKVGYRPGHWP